MKIHLLNDLNNFENVTHSAQGENGFFGGNFLFRISELTQRERICSFRKLQIFILQTTDSHFANYRFSFRKLQISILQTTDFHFVSSHFVSFHFVLSHFVSQTTVSPPHRRGSSSIPRLNVVCGLSLLVLYSALKGFSSGTPVLITPSL